MFIRVDPCLFDRFMAFGRDLMERNFVLANFSEALAMVRLEGHLVSWRYEWPSWTQGKGRSIEEAHPDLVRAKPKRAMEGAIVSKLSCL